MTAVFDRRPDWRALGLVVALHLAVFFAFAHLQDNLHAQAHVAELQGSLIVSLVAAPPLPPAPEPPPHIQRPIQPRPVIQPLPPPVLTAPAESVASAEKDVSPPPTTPSPVEMLPVEIMPSTPVALQISTAPVSESAPVPVTLPRFDADYLDNPAPNYPVLSRRLAEQGLVLLRVYVEPSGLAARVELKQSSGYERLDNAARSAVSHWRFVPARKGAESVGAWVIVPISFNLRS